MKRLLTLLIATAAVAIMAIPAFATIAGSPHDYSGLLGYGRCGVCHVPHAAGGTKRLWRLTPSAMTGYSLTAWANTDTGPLCYGCHGDGYLTSAASATGATPHQKYQIFGSADVHRKDLSVLTGQLELAADGPTPILPATGKPYTDPAKNGGQMECTSCHNVHFDGTWDAASISKRPFLRNNTPLAGISGFCGDCHTTRVNTAGSGTNNTTGNHPVNIAYDGNPATNTLLVGSNRITLVGTPPSALTHTIGTGAGLISWSLGGKFQDSTYLAKTGTSVGSTDTIGCETCHAVHNDATDSVQGTDQKNHLLAINNVNTTPTSPLCEGCHGNPTGNTARANSGATFEVGFATGDHPIDIGVVAPGPIINRWYLVGTGGNTTVRKERTELTDKTWPNPLNGSSQHTIVCSSCHSAHRARTIKTDSSTGAGKLTRKGATVTTDDTTSGDWCTACHSDPSPAGHHSHSANTGATGYPTNYVSKLGCSSCHGSGLTASFAHNGFNFNSGFVSGASNNASQLCNYCHLGLTTAGAVPANGTNVDPVGEIVDGTYDSSGTNTNGAGIPNGHIISASATHDAGAVHTMQSHFVGTFANNAGYVNVKTGNWATTASGATAYSKYGGSGGVDTHGAVADTLGNQLVCESCHNVLHNIGATGASGITVTSTSGYMNNLLLQDYQDDNGGASGSNTVDSGLCIACHNHDASNASGFGTSAGPVDGSLVNNAQSTNIPDGTHMMTGWTIDRAVTAGRAQTTLQTSSGSYANANVGGGVLPYPSGTDTMDCDTCHVPHAAPANATFDETKAGVANKALTGNVVTRPIIIEKLDSTAPANDSSSFCQKCHTEGL